MEKLQSIIEENIKYFWENDPLITEEHKHINTLWDGFKKWCIQNCKENFEELEISIIEEAINNNFDNWKTLLFE